MPSISFTVKGGILCVLLLVNVALSSAGAGYEIHEGTERRLRNAIKQPRSLVAVGETVRVYNDSQMLLAFINSSIETVLIAAPRIILNTTVVTEVLARFNLTPPILIQRNLTIRGDPELSTWPVLNLKYYKDLLRMESGITLRIIHIVGFGLRRDMPSRVPGMDFVAPMSGGGQSYLLAGPAILTAPVCYDADLSEQDVRNMVVDPNYPPTRVNVRVPQDHCVNDTTAPYDQQCWALRVLFEEANIAGMVEDEAGRVVPNNVLLQLRNATVVCFAIVSDECKHAQQGQVFFCLLEQIRSVSQRFEDLADGVLAREATALGGQDPGAVGPELPQSEAAPSSSTGSSGSTALIVGLAAGCAGGALLAITIVIVALYRRRRLLRGIACSASGHSSSSKEQCIGGDNKLHGGLRRSEGYVAVYINNKGPRPSPSSGPLCLDPSDIGRPKVAPALKMYHPVTPRDRPRGDLQLGVKLDDSSEASEDGKQQPATPTGEHQVQQERSSAEPSEKADDGAGQSNASLRSSAKAVQLLPVVRGRGGFGRVVEGMYDGQRVAVKMMAELPHLEERSESLAKAFEGEVQILSRCCHPNIVRLLAACVTPPRLFLVLELMEASLENLLYGNTSQQLLLPMPKVLHIGIETCRALAYLHPTILHRDLKPANVLINNPLSDRPVVKLTDFGLSRLRDTVVPTEHAGAGTPAYMPPECFEVGNKMLMHQADIFSLGVLIWEMLSGCKPWQNTAPVAIAFMVGYRGQRLPLKGISSERLPRKLARLLLACWDADPVRRPAADEVGKELTLLLQQVAHA